MLDRELIDEKTNLLDSARRENVVHLFDVTIRLEENFRSWCKAEYHYKGAEIAQIALHTIAGRRRSGPNAKPIDELRRRLVAIRDRYSKAESLWRAGVPYWFSGQCSPAGCEMV